MSNTNNWAIDPAHSKVQFSVRHLVISEVTGEFKSFGLNIESPNDNLEASSIEFTIDAATLNTGIADRDNHLKSADFFEVEKFPVIKFKSTQIKKVDNENYKMRGELNIKDVTKPIELDVNFGGRIIDPWGNHRAGYKIQGSLNRFDYNLSWNNLIETGGAVVGKTVKINSDIEIVKPKQ